MNLIEIPKASKELCIKAFKENILNNFNLENINKLASTGQLDQKYLRCMAWKIFLDEISPKDSLDKWKEDIIYQRTEYKILSDKTKKQQEFFEEEDKKNTAYNYDIKSSYLKNKSIVYNPFRPEKETRNLINLDLSRTLQELSLFHDENIKNKLSHILYLWSLENSNIGYQQGMNNILSIIFLALYPYYFKNDKNEENNIINYEEDKDEDEELYLFFHDEDELESDLYICFNKAMEKGIKILYESEFNSKEEQNEYIKNICLFDNELENIINKNEDTNAPLYIRSSMVEHEKLKVIDNKLFSHFKKIGLDCTIFLQRWIKCFFSFEFGFKDVLIIWDYIISSNEIKKKYDFAKVDIIAISMLLRIRDYLFFCDQSQCFMILLQYPKINNIIELISFSDMIKEAIKDLLSGINNDFLENLTSFPLNHENNNKNKYNKIGSKEISPPFAINNYEEGIEKLLNIFNKYHSLMEVNDQKEFHNVIQFFNKNK